MVVISDETARGSTHLEDQFLSLAQRLAVFHTKATIGKSLQKETFLVCLWPKVGPSLCLALNACSQLLEKKPPKPSPGILDCNACTRCKVRQLNTYEEHRVGNVCFKKYFF